MQLSFASSFLSIKEFPSITIPNFTLITGVNGTGKTHLLRAITEGRITVDIAPNRPNDVRFFDWTNIVPNDSGMFDGHGIIQETNSYFDQFFAYQQRYSEDIVVAARNSGVSGRMLVDPIGLGLLEIEDFRFLLGNDDAALLALNNIRLAVNQASSNILGSNGDPNWQRHVDRVSKELGKPIACLTRSDFFRSRAVPSWGTANIFQHSFSQLFVAYRDIWLSNKVRQLAVSQGKTDVHALSDEEFFERHMAPPWEFVNKAFELAGLDFEINKPEEYENIPFHAKLKKRSSRAEISFNDLSSGEKVLMSFALCLYFTSDKRQLMTYTKSR